MEGSKLSLCSEHSIYTPRRLYADISTSLKASNPSFSAKNKTPIIGVLFLYLHIWRVTEAVITGRS